VARQCGYRAGADPARESGDVLSSGLAGDVQAQNRSGVRRVTGTYKKSLDRPAPRVAYLKGRILRDARPTENNEENKMPFVRIDMVEGKPETYRKTVGDVVYDAMRSTLNVPENDKFIVISEHSPAEMMISPDYLDIQRSPNCIVIQITLNAGRTTEMKKAFYHAVAYGLHEKVGLRLEDAFISLVEVPKENWSFGNGEAQYA
jgi:phenylpyruvate tautomerase PptA (4-oxalocrotonate tautomerase family)